MSGLGRGLVLFVAVVLVGMGAGLGILVAVEMVLRAVV